MSAQLYKIIRPDGSPAHSGSGLWPLPSETDPGEWRTVDGPLEPCRNGLHLVSRDQMRQWLVPGCLVYRVETDGELINNGDKHVARKVRLLPGPVAADDVMTVHGSYLGAASHGVPAYVQRAAARVNRERGKVSHHPLADVKLPRGHILADRMEALQGPLRRAEAAYDAAMARATAAASRRVARILGDAA